MKPPEIVATWARLEAAKSSLEYHQRIAGNLRTAAGSGSASSRDLLDAEYQLDLARIEFVAAMAAVSVSWNDAFSDLSKALAAVA